MISPSHIAAVFGFNRYIVECKFKYLVEKDVNLKI